MNCEAKPEAKPAPCPLHEDEPCIRWYSREGAHGHPTVDDLLRAAARASPGVGPLTSEQELTLLKAVLSLVRQSQLRRAREFNTGAKMPHLETETPPR